MAGVKGRSGRKSLKEEWDDNQLLGMCTSWLVRHFDSFTKEEKMKVALTIAPKGITEKHEHSGNLDVSSILNRMANNQLNLQ